MSISDRKEHTYIGDGVIASHDGYHVWIQLAGAEHKNDRPIGLDPIVFEQLIQYRDRVFSRKDDTCPECHGKGWYDYDGEKQVDCDWCNQTGRV